MLLTSQQSLAKKNIWTQCGIGALIFDHTGWAAATSNIIWDWGTTASTTTTSSEDQCAGKAANTAKFIFETYANLEEETVTGDGQHVHAMLDILGCEQDSQPKIIDSIRENFKSNLKSTNYSSATKLTKAESYYDIVMTKVTKSFAKKCRI